MKNSTLAGAKTKTRLPCFWGIAFIVAVASLIWPSRVSGSALDNGESTLSVAELKTFGTAGKEGLLYPDREVVLFQHEGAGCLTHMWFGGDWPGYDRTRIRFYVDGETKPSIDMELFLGHGIGWGDPSAPWGSERLGKTGHPSGLYNTYRIPFGKSIRVTGQLGAGVEKPQVFWWIIRGVENLPVFLGNIRLPDNARLRLQVRDNVELEPLQIFDILPFKRGFVWLGETAKKKTGNLMECRSAAEPRAMSGSMNGQRVC